jgi:hypothetical protein
MTTKDDTLSLYLRCVCSTHPCIHSSIEPPTNPHRLLYIPPASTAIDPPSNTNVSTFYYQAAPALPFDPFAILSHIRGSTTVVRWTIGLDLIVAILAIVGGVTVLFTHYAGGGPDLRPYGFADIDGVPMAMAFVLG